jgi:hypothetical protein
LTTQTVSMRRKICRPMPVSAMAARLAVAIRLRGSRTGRAFLAWVYWAAPTMTGVAIRFMDHMYNKRIFVCQQIILFINPSRRFCFPDCPPMFICSSIFPCGRLRRASPPITSRPGRRQKDDPSSRSLFPKGRSAPEGALPPPMHSFHRILP